MFTLMKSIFYFFQWGYNTPKPCNFNKQNANTSPIKVTIISYFQIFRLKIIFLVFFYFARIYRIFLFTGTKYLDILKKLKLIFFNFL